MVLKVSKRIHKKTRFIITGTGIHHCMNKRFNVVCFNVGNWTVKD